MSNSEGAESLWNDIFQKHWDFLGTEENSEKFEKRKCLESNHLFHFARIYKLIYIFLTF